MYSKDDKSYTVTYRDSTGLLVEDSYLCESDSEAMRHGAWLVSIGRTDVLVTDETGSLVFYGG